MSKDAAGQDPTDATDMWWGESIIMQDGDDTWELYIETAEPDPTLPHTINLTGKAKLITRDTGTSED